jgi:hypothetical protein
MPREMGAGFPLASSPENAIKWFFDALLMNALERKGGGEGHSQFRGEESGPLGERPAEDGQEIELVSIRIIFQI